MDEYIDREAAIEICEKEYRERLRMADYCGDTVAWNIGAEIKNMPAADVAPVRHGRWIKESDGGTRCSVCNKRVRNVTGGWYEPVDLSDMPYCPKCGAKMDETVEENKE